MMLSTHVVVNACSEGQEPNIAQALEGLPFQFKKPNSELIRCMTLCTALRP